MIVRQFFPKDYQNVVSLGETVYPKKLHEPFNIFVSRLEAYPKGMFCCFDNEEIVGYVVSHPYNHITIPELFEPLIIPEKCNCYYIHDLVVKKEHQKKGIGRRLAEKAIGHGKKIGYEDFSLISVNNSEKFWNSIGFQTVRTLEYIPKVIAKEMRMRL